MRSATPCLCARSGLMSPHLTGCCSMAQHGAGVVGSAALVELSRSSRTLPSPNALRESTRFLLAAWPHQLSMRPNNSRGRRISGARWGAASSRTIVSVRVCVLRRASMRA
eukprot:2429588-Prymnesium_polylepis.1